MARTNHGRTGVYNASPITLPDGKGADLGLDVNGNTKTNMATRIAGEDLTNDVLKVEQRYIYTRLTADGQVKSGAGFVHTVTFSPTGSVTAGVISLYDSLTETGTIIFSVSLPVTTFTPFSVHIDSTFATGLFVGYDATVANVQTTVSSR